MMRSAESVSSTDPAVEVVPAPTDAVVEAWLQTWFYNVGIPTELQNRLRDAADNLKARLAGRE